MNTKEKNTSTRVTYLAVTKIRAAPSDNPRFVEDGDTKHAEAKAAAFFKSKEFKALCAALNATGGPTSPVIVENEGDGTYNMLDGWGRHQWAVLRTQRLKKIVMLPCIVKPKLTDSARMHLRVALNTARNAYDPLAEGAAFHRLLLHFGAVNQVAKRIGRPVSVVNDRIRLYNLPDHVRRLLQHGRLMLSAAEVFFRIDGNVDYVAAKNGETLDDERKKKAAEYERIVGIMVSEIDRRFRDGRVKSFSRSNVRSIYNTAIGKAVKRRGGTYLNIVARQIEQHCPEKDKMERFTLAYGHTIVSELLSAKPDMETVEQCEKDIVLLGVARGLSCPVELVNVNVDDDNRPVYTEAVASALNRALVRRTVAYAYLQKTRRAIPNGHELTLSQAAWENFLHGPKNLTSMLSAIQEVSVPVT